MLTVREALSLGRLQEGNVIAGEKGLARVVNYIDILEVPDISTWLKEDELILTTGYAIKDKPDMQVKLVEELARVEGAGIIIKLHRFMDSIPEIMIKKANELNLPIIQLPSDIPYIDITHVIMREILLRQNNERWLNEMLKEVMNSEFYNIHELKKKFKSINDKFNTDSPFVLAVANYGKIKDIKRLFKYESIKNNPKIISGHINDSYILICEAKCDDNWKEEIEKTLFIPEIMDEVSTKGIVCLISRVIDNLMKMKSEYKKLYSTLKIIEQLPNKRVVHFYDDIVHYIFLNNICRLNIAREFVDYILEPFSKIEEKERDILLNTLHALARNNGNLSKTAQKNFMHINTLRYRVNKIEKILKVPIDSPEELFKYNIALILYSFMRKNR